MSSRLLTFVDSGRRVARAKPDGQTLLVSSVSLAANKSPYKKRSYDPLTDFMPVSLISLGCPSTSRCPRTI
jgi:hypothetical protein